MSASLSHVEHLPYNPDRTSFPRLAAPGPQLVLLPFGKDKDDLDDYRKYDVSTARNRYKNLPDKGDPQLPWHGSGWHGDYRKCDVGLQ